MGMGIPIPVGIPWESHGNGKGWQVCDERENGDGSGIVGMGLPLFSLRKKFPTVLLTTGSSLNIE